VRRADIDAQNRCLLQRQHRFRHAADVVADAFAAFPEVEAVALVGSVARPLCKEVPRFRQLASAGIKVWHECGDLDLGLWLTTQDRLGELRRARDHVLNRPDRPGANLGVATHEVDVFLFEPGSDRYLGRLCHYRECPKGKLDCLTPGCGAIPFNKVFPNFWPRPDLLAGAAFLYRRGEGRLRSALDLPSTDPDGVSSASVQQRREIGQ
jgi:hypothetical protein